MRNISEAGLAKLMQRLGTEPITIVEIDWVNGKTTAYADRTVESIPGKIVEMGDVDSATSLSGNASTSSVTLTLDDTDGSVKSILDSHDVHKCRARVYQYFAGLALSDKFLVFSGVLMTPLVWNERARTVVVTIVSKLEDQECGFTTDQSVAGVLPSNIPNDPWPMIFGTISNNRAVRLRNPVNGSTLQAVGVLGGAEALMTCPDSPGIEFALADRKTYSQLNFLLTLIGIYTDARGKAKDAAVNASSYSDQYAPMGEIEIAAMFTKAAAQYDQLRAGYIQQWEQLTVQRLRKLTEFEVQKTLTREKRQLLLEQAQLDGYGANPVHILGGETFPQGPVTANINGAIFTGTMSGNELTITDRQSAYLEALAAGILNNMTNGEELVAAPVTVLMPNAVAYTPGQAYESAEQLANTVGTVTSATETTFYAQNQGCVSDTWNWSARVPDGWDGRHWKTYTTDWEQDTVTANVNVDNYASILQHLWIDQGASVQIMSPDTLVYVASITPGRVTAVKATCNVGGVQLLVDVPSYTIRHVPYRSAVGNTFIATEVVLPQLMSSIVGEHWGDDLYITFESDIGPEVTDTLQWIIETFGDLTCDDASFAACHVPYPANFAINSNRDVLGVLQDIAFQACCRLFIDDNVVYIQYLPTRPTPVDTITESDIDAEAGIEVSLTSSDELATRMAVHWSELPVPELEVVNERTWNGTTYANRWVSGSDAGDLHNPSYSLVMRNNIAKYGVHDVSYNFTIFNQRSYVQACAAFWLKRKSNTWKRVKFTTPLHKLNLETFDAVTLDCAQPYVSSGPVLVLIESAKYDSANNCIHFECVTPVLAGTAGDCGFFWEGQ